MYLFAKNRLSELPFSFYVEVLSSNYFTYNRIVYRIELYYIISY